MTLIEKVARTIYERRNGVGCRPWSIQTKSHKGPYFEDARAAIEAMREPTETMSQQGEFTPFECHSDVTWRAMIDAALNDK